MLHMRKDDGSAEAEMHLKIANHMVDFCDGMYRKEDPGNAVACFGNAVKEFGKYLRQEENAKRAAGNMSDFLMHSSSRLSSYMTYDFDVPKVSATVLETSTARGALEGIYFLINDISNLIVGKCDSIGAGEKPKTAAAWLAVKVAEVRTIALLEKADAHFKLLEYTANWNEAEDRNGQTLGSELSYLMNTYNEAFRFADLTEDAWGRRASLDYYKGYAHYKEDSARLFAESLRKE